MRKEIITKVDPKSPASEVFRSLRTNIQYVNNGRKNQTILLTSTAQGEGKSWIAANLATTFAQAGKYVIIVDADMRRPRQNSIFNVQMFPGLSNYLSGVDVNGLYKEIRIKECIRETEVKNLYLIPAGNIPPNPSELLLGEKIIILINELKKVFDVIIFANFKSFIQAVLFVLQSKQLIHRFLSKFKIYFRLLSLWQPRFPPLFFFSGVYCLWNRPVSLFCVWVYCFLCVLLFPGSFCFCCLSVSPVLLMV